MTRALICGISGQDGAYLASFLLGKGYEIWGTSRDAQTTTFSNLSQLGISERVKLVSMAPSDFRSVLEVLNKSMPDEIYNLAGQTSVGLSFEQPAQALESIASSTLNLLEAILFLARPVRFYNAGSSECFGDTGAQAASESTLFQPRSPYAVAKATAHWLVDNYRSAYQLQACTGILFNHESPLRPTRFVTRKIIESAIDIASGQASTLRLGTLDVSRDWGWAPEYVEAMWAMLQTDCRQDYVIATGKSFSLRDSVASAFAEVGLDWNDHVVQDAELVRRSEITYSQGNPDKASRELGWSARRSMPEVVKEMVAASRLARQPGAVLPLRDPPR